MVKIKTFFRDFCFCVLKKTFFVFFLLNDPGWSFPTTRILYQNLFPLPMRLLFILMIYISCGKNITCLRAANEI